MHLIIMLKEKFLCSVSFYVFLGGSFFDRLHCGTVVFATYIVHVITLAKAAVIL